MAILLFGHGSSGRTSLLSAGLYTLKHSASGMFIKYECITGNGRNNPFRFFEENISRKDCSNFLPESTLEESTLMATLCSEEDKIQDSFAIYVDGNPLIPEKIIFSDFECNQIIYLLDGEIIQKAYFDDNPRQMIENTVLNDIELLGNGCSSLEKVEYLNIFITKSDLVLCDFRLREILSREKIAEDLIDILSKTTFFQNCVVNYSFVTLGQELIRGISMNHYKPYHTEYVFLIPMLNQLWWKYNRITKIIGEKQKQIEEIKRSSTKSRNGRLKLESQVKEILQPSADKDKKYIKNILEQISNEKVLYNKNVKSTFGEYMYFKDKEESEG